MSAALFLALQKYTISRKQNFKNSMLHSIPAHGRFLEECMLSSQKDALRRMRENGKSYGQIAAALGLSENTVKSLYVQGYGGACDAELLYRRTDPQHPQTPCGGHARVSTNDEEQANSYEAQVSHYTRHIQENLEWEFVSVYADKGITGTSTKKRGIPPQNTRR